MSEYPPPPQYPSGSQPDERNLATVAHVGTLINFVTGGFGFLVPLIIMLTRGKQSAYVRQAAVESLNFQISLIIYAVISGVLVLVLIGFLLLGVVALVGLILPIVAATKTSNGEQYRYPFTIRLVS